MPTTPDPQTTEHRARELLDRRITSVRTLVTARHHIADLRDQLAQAERADTTAYNAALKDGWTPDELRTLGLGEPDKKPRVKRRTSAARAAAAPAPAREHAEQTAIDSQ